MKNLRFLTIVAIMAITGCATSLAPSDGFNDWTSPSQPTAYTPKQRSVYAEMPASVAANYSGENEPSDQ